MLTANQKTILKTHLGANTNTVVVGGTVFPINSNDVLPTDHSMPSDESAQQVAAHYNAVFVPTYLTWNPLVDKAKADQLVDLSVYTPTDAVPANDSNNQYLNRTQVCMLKQTNALKLTQGIGTIDARAAGLRKNFQDCMRQVPSGAAGANLDAGWGAPATPGVVRLAMQRSATIAEKLFAVAGTGSGNTGADPRGSTTNPDVTADDANGAAILTFSPQDIKDAWTS